MESLNILEGYRMMTRDKLYDMAFRYKKAGLWKKLWDTEIFAIRLKSGDIGYISVMGKNSEYCALGIYIGEEGFQSYRIIANMGGYVMFDSEFIEHEMLLQQKCLQVALLGKDELMEEEVEEVRDYAKRNDIRISGKNAYPQFVKFEPNYHPWKVKTKEDMNALYEAMEAAVLLADKLRTKTPEALGIVAIDQDTEEAPLFEVRGGKLAVAGVVPLPGDREESYAYVKAESEIALASVKKLPRKGIWETEIIRMLEPVQDDPEETPYYPLLLLIVDSKSGYMLPVPMVKHAEESPQEVLQEFANAWKMQKAYPKEIRCRDERTYALLKDFCEKTGVKISIYKREMHALDDAEDALMEQLTDSDEDGLMDDMADAIDAILSMSREELQFLPKPLVEQLKMLASHDVFPKEIAVELTKKLKGL